MKWSYKFIVENGITGYQFKEEVTFDPLLIEKSFGILELKNVIVSGELKYNKASDICLIDVNVKGTMVVPCAISLKPVDYLFDDIEQYQYTFTKTNESDEILLVKGGIIDLVPFIWQLIVVNIPLRVVKDGVTLKKIDNNEWSVVSDDDLKKEQIDPRLAILKQIKFDTEEK